MVTPKNKGLKRLACQYVCEQQTNQVYLFVLKIYVNKAYIIIIMYKRATVYIK
jgi:hypothetical protein